MKAVIQRVTSAKVEINGKIKSEIGSGLLILIGVAHQDSATDVAWLAQKILNMRIFSDADGKMNQSIKEIDG